MPLGAHLVKTDIHGTSSAGSGSVSCGKPLGSRGPQHTALCDRCREKVAHGHGDLVQYDFA